MEKKPVVLVTGGFGTIGLSMQDVVEELKIKKKDDRPVDKEHALQ